MRLSRELRAATNTNVQAEHYWSGGGKSRHRRGRGRGYGRRCRCGRAIGRVVPHGVAEVVARARAAWSRLGRGRGEGTDGLSSSAQHADLRVCERRPRACALGGTRAYDRSVCAEDGRLADGLVGPRGDLMERRCVLQGVCAREEERVGWTQEEAVGRPGRVAGVDTLTVEKGQKGVWTCVGKYPLATVVWRAWWYRAR